MDENNLKVIYQLWIEYLKRSEPYRTLCEYVKRKGTLPLAPIPDELKGKETLVVNYLMFGDIHKQTFEETLFKIETWKEIFSSMSSPVEDYSNVVESDIDRLIQAFKKQHGRKPNINEFKTNFLNLMKYSSLMYLRVNLSRSKVDDLKNKFAEILKGQKKRIKAIPSLIPNPGIRLEELERYLRVFDYRKDGLKWDKIISIEPHRKKALDNERAFKRDHQLAKKIIKNVEKGVFPGKY